MANNLMAVFAWESGGTFKADVPNRKNSGATGLIQFMPETAKELLKKSVTEEVVANYYNSKNKSLHNLKRIKEFAQMTEVQQLDYVKQYFNNLANKELEFVDFYLQVLFPASSGRAEHIVFAETKRELNNKEDKHADLRVEKYGRNSGLDVNGDGRIYKAEIASKTKHFLSDGAIPLNKDIRDKCITEDNKKVTPYQNTTYSPNSKSNKKIIVLDPGHGILGSKANVGTQIRLLKMKESFGDSKFKVGQNYSWQDLPDEIINNAHKYFQFIENKDPKSPTESEYVFERAVDIKKLLERDGHNVILTRDKKETISYMSIPEISVCKSLGISSIAPINYRNEIANFSKADYFISLHCDGLENLTSNSAVICYIDDNGKKLADKVIKRYSQIKGVAKSRSDLGVLKNKAKYKILIELGFMTTPFHMKILKKNHNIIVGDIYTAIRDHINEN